MSSKTPTPDNLKAAPMTYTVERAASFTTERVSLAQTAESLDVEELEERAAEVQIDLSGTKTKREKVDAIREQVRGSETVTEA